MIFNYSLKYDLMLYMLYFTTHTPIETICPNGHECVAANRTLVPLLRYFQYQNQIGYAIISRYFV